MKTTVERTIISGVCLASVVTSFLLKNGITVQTIRDAFHYFFPENRWRASLQKRPEAYDFSKGRFRRCWE